MSGVGIGSEVAGGDEELGTQDRAHARQRLDDRRLWMRAEGGANVTVAADDPLVQVQQRLREFGDDAGRHLLAGKFGQLRPRGLNGCARDKLGAVDAHGAFVQPLRQPGGTGAADPLGVW